ncbi:MAG: hypothetical protein WC373_00365 [Smithella sp.]|jgi:hypothetical protein
MPERYELIFGFVHCRGKTTYHAGYADTLAEAQAWLKKNREALAPSVKAPPEDPVRYCKAAWCPFKRQKPWFDIRTAQKQEKS